MTLVTHKIRGIVKAQLGLAVPPINNKYLIGSDLTVKPQNVNTIRPSRLRNFYDMLKYNAGTIKQGLNIYSNKLGEDVEFGGNAAAFNDAFKIIGLLPGVAGWIGTGLDFGMNALGNAFGSSVKYDPSVSTMKAINQLGSSYQDSVNTINNAASNDSKYFLNATGKRKAKQRRNEAITSGKNLEIIADNTTDQYDSINDLLSYNYHNKQLGGFDYTTSFLKIGGKIDMIKSKLLFTKIHTFELIDPVNIFKIGGVIDLNGWEPTIIEDVIEFQEGGKIKKASFEDWYASIPENSRGKLYDYKKAYEILDWETLSNHAKDPNKYHLPSVSNIADKDGNYPFLKLGKVEDNPEIQGEFDWYNSEEGKEHKSKFDIKYINDRYYYVPKSNKENLENGGKIKQNSETPEISEKNLIPEGALHKNKHHIENTEELTQKGIPVIDNDGDQQAEIERDEWIMSLELTKIIEDLYHKYYSEELTNKEKDELAIEAGKIITDLLLNNTDDRTSLIDKTKI